MNNSAGIVILNYNTPNDVLACVESIIKKTNFSYHIYVVDNCSQDDSLEIFNKSYSENSKVTVLFSNSNNGFSAGNNIGIKEAIKDNHKYIALINADILLDNSAIDISINKLENDDSIGVVAPSVLTPNTLEETQFARNKLTYANFLGEKTFLKHIKKFVKNNPRIIKQNSFDSDYKFFGMTYGCFYVIRTEILIKTNLLDEEVFLFNEEDILAYKLEKTGYMTLITPEATVIHNHHSSISKTSVANRTFHFRISELIVLRKYAHTSLLKLMPIIFTFRLNWIIKSIKSKDFRKFLKKFNKKLNYIYKIKKEY